MKKFALLLLLGGTMAFTSCGEETTPEEEITNEIENNAILDQATQQIADSTSMLNKAIDTLEKVIEENHEEIDEKIEEGLDALNKSLK